MRRRDLKKKLESLKKIGFMRQKWTNCLFSPESCVKGKSAPGFDSIKKSRSVTK